MKIQIFVLHAKTHTDYGKVINKELIDSHKFVNNVIGDAKTVTKKERIVFNVMMIFTYGQVFATE